MDEKQDSKSTDKAQNEAKYDENELKISLMVNTKLGNSTEQFLASHLKQLTYFANQLSGRWSNNNLINISNNELNFDMNELKALIHFKQNNKMTVKYPYERLPFLCNALDYFTETIKEDKFVDYFNAYIPTIRPKTLLLFKSLCQSKECTIICNSIDAYLKQISETTTKINNKIINNWRNVSSELLICNDYIAASIFVDHFKFIGRWMYQLSYFLEFAEHRDVNDLNILWTYISVHKLYLYYPSIITNIFMLEYQSDIKIDKDTAKTLTRICLDIIDAVYNDNMEKQVKLKNLALKSLIQSYYKIIKDQEFEASVAEFSYDFLMAVLMKLLKLRRQNSEIYNKCFGDIDILNHLLVNNFGNILSAISKRDLVNDIEAINRQLNKEEKCSLLKLLLENHHKMKLENTVLQSIIKPLIEVDFDQSFILTILWFPLFMKTHIDYITKELPNKTSWNALQTLIAGICDYIASVQYKHNPCPNIYIEFINEFTNVNWKVKIHDSNIKS